MKKFISATIIALTLSACSFILPIEHDPVMFGRAVDAKIAMEKVNCVDKSNWNHLLIKVEELKVYSDERKDPQATNMTQLEDAVKKAHDSKNVNFCESIMNLQKTRLEVTLDAWRGR